MALAELPRFPDVVSIIPETGIQFLDFGFSQTLPDGSRNARIPDGWGFVDPLRAGKTGDPRTIPALVRRADVDLSPQKENYQIDLKAIVEFVGRTWVPLPLLREEPGRKFRQGPTNWARAYLVEIPEGDRHGNRYRLVIAIDSAMMDEFADTSYLAPSPEDARNGRRFSLPGSLEHYGFFLDAAWVREWLNESYRIMIEEQERQRTKRRDVDLSDADIESLKMGPNEALARYIAFLDLLNELDILPKITFPDTFTADRQVHVDVDMVLDVGNSRTCGLLVEAEPGSRGADINRAFKLELRDLSQPERTYGDPFNSRLEFAIAKFGRDNHSHRSGRADAFSWPTIVRVGPEAVRLAGQREGSTGQTGMSSPKRYLWDEEPSQQSWMFNGETLDGEREGFAAQGVFASLVNDAGQALHLLQEGETDDLPALLARYSRSNLVTFLLAEILLQAIVMMNTPAQRLRRQNAELPRRLRRLILTMPTALSMAERQILKDRAQAALELVYLCLGKAERKPGERGDTSLVWLDGQKPDIELKWDEASSTQVVYLYSQIALGFSGDARAFIEAVRAGSVSDKPADSLRIGTLDIGGGTTDLVITELEAQGQGANVTIFPYQLFRESFSLAGDDIVQRMVQEVLIKAFTGRLEQQVGRDRADTLVQSLFGGNRGDITAEEQLRRQQFATQIAAPVAISLLSLYENYDAARPSAPEERPLSSFFAADAQPPAGVVAAINQAAHETGASGFSLSELMIPVNLPDVDRVVRAVITDMLRALTEVAWRYQVDILLLSGRPSRFPAMRDVIIETGTLPGHRVLPMHEFRVGQWYPFRNREARIADPKTTAAVGGMICLLAEGNLHNFNFRSDRLRASSVARYLGKVENSNRLLAQDVYYADIDLENPDYVLPTEGGFEFRGPMALGARQFPQEWWPATLLYTLDYTDDNARREMQPRTPLKMQLVREQRPRLGRRPAEGVLTEVNDVLVVSRNIEDRNGSRVRGDAVTLRLQTLRNRDGYWLDTGILVDL